MSRFIGSIVRNPDGYEWDDARMAGFEDEEPTDGEEISLGPIGDDDQWRTWIDEGGVPPSYLYDPFVREPALFRIFAGLEPTREAILDFANRYGDIALYANQFFGGMDDPQDGATFQGWKDAIELMLETLEGAEELMNTRPSKANAAKHAGEITEFITNVFGRAPVFMTPVYENGALTLRAATYTLFDAMLLQLVESIVDKKQYRTCEFCGKPFELTPQVNRSDRVYCSDNCRVKAYNRRRKQAIKLRAEGQTLREIAIATGSDIQTIKQWVQPKGK